jgi:NO-binding membrane sensor protein with MHYT domain/CheY-like chemotaxis protein/two-component sensor histidine kinase
MAQHYHYWLVLVSILVAILASYTALTLALRIRVASRQTAPAWLVGGGVAMGIGIWSMHFVGMLALMLPIDIAYDLSVTLLSMLIAIVVSTFALHIASRRHVGRAALVGAGVAMGVGICAMHYVGMAAIEIAPPIRHDPLWVAVSFAIAIAASFAALGIAFSSPPPAGWRRYHRAFGAIGMGLAIAGMHYAAMVAAEFPTGAVSGATLVNKGWLAGAVTTITLFVLFATLLLSLIEARAAARAARMQASLAEVAETSRAKDEFLAMLGHELRNPLASIASAVHLLKQVGVDETHRQFAQDVIARQSQHLARIVDDLLDVGRAITGKIMLHRQPIDLNATVAEALRTLDAAGTTSGRQVQAEGASVWVDADRTRIEQIVNNLVLNAVQHTTTGGRIAVRVAVLPHAAALSVSDDGAGMDRETAARVFELFFQANQGPERRRGGLGIGLTLARRIAELHGGTLDAASDGPSRGATFTLRLPAVAAPAGSVAGESDGGSRCARRVVIVEDSEDARLSLQRILEREGHTVHTAADGPSGFDAITHLRPDVALIDIGLPGLDGYRIAQQLRSKGLRTYLIALTGYGRAEDRSRARESGFDEHLTKPPPMERLLELVAAASA